MNSTLSSSKANIATLLRELSSHQGGFDEVRNADGSFRLVWQKFLQSVGDLSLQDLSVRQDVAQRLLREHGAIYTIYEEASKKDSRWKFDILPHLIDADEWSYLEGALKQRSRLLRMIVDDLYGERKLIQEGRLPPALLHANPNFLRAASGIRPPGGHFLFHHAVDLAHGPGGEWMVIADRTQAPSGKGYALENRIIATHLFSDEFCDLNVERLSGFFQVERDSLRALAPQNKLDPMVVLLTPGPLNETYFEHVFKARYLGFPLVEGADLTVRGSKVYLKTLEGLRQVDVIVRRVDDSYCDPLELHSDTWLGVAGLVEAWRSGSVAIANGLGSGVVETSALLPFLPGLSRHLLSEDLLLPNAITWWCGQSKVWESVQQHLEDFVIKPAFVGSEFHPAFPTDLESSKLEELIERVNRTPHLFTAQQRLNLSTTPVFAEGRLEQRSVVLRCYIVPNGDDFVVMPGGLTRVSPDPESLVVNMQWGGISKDTWVLSKAPVYYQSLLLPSNHVQRPERQAGEMPSRVADHFFWLGRYMERLETSVRVLRTALLRLSGERNEGQAKELKALISWLKGLKYLPEDLSLTPSTHQLRVEFCDFMQKTVAEESLPNLLHRARYNAFVVRDRLSDDTWRLFNELDRDASVRNRNSNIQLALQTLGDLILDLAAFSGMEMENMSRGHGWRFLDLGRRIERSSQLMLFFKQLVATSPRDDLLLGPLLEICDSSMTYRRCYHAMPSLGPVLDLLIADETNPRSMMWQLQQMARHVSRLPRDGYEGDDKHEKRQVDGMLSVIASTQFSALAKAEDLQPGNLSRLCEHLLGGVMQLSNTITQHYFAHALPRVR